ncbi:uncharacterized protein [Coffea arabica]|uniref:Uncharacterized protein n=1 Tax=Coffea arabica TaxID=13443 RepID=A0ABM4UQH8_COFAR
MRVLEAYQRSSGQILNAHKSGYLAHPSLSVALRRVIERITGFSRQVFPTRYLRFPLYIGRCKMSFFAEVCQKVMGKILSWKSKFLSSGERLILIKHVLSAIPVHLLSAAVMPKAVFRIIERVCANFLWGSSDEGLRYHWMGWRKLCLPLEEDGVGFRRLQDVYTAFSYKLWWQFRTESSLWTTFMHAKYCQKIHPCQAECKPLVSAIWRRMQDVSRQVELSMLWLGHWNAQLLSQVLPRDIIAVVLSKSVPNEQSADEVVWMPARSGKFSLVSAYQECPWHVRGEVRQIWSLVRDPSRFSHYFREANKIADALANVGVAHPHQDVQLYEHWSDWPRLARGGVSLDSMGVPSFRMVRNS